jgi:hypothetical protein
VNTVVLNPATADYTLLGVGSLVLVGTERLIVTGRRYSTVSGQTLTSTINDFQATTTVPVTSGAAFAVGETIYIDSEKMRITEIINNNLICDRAYDGTVLAAHTSGAAVSAKRTFIVKRGALGTTAASHSNGDSAYVHEYPEPLPELVTAEVCMMMGAAIHEDMKGYVDGLRDAAYYALGRVSRIGAI